MSFTEQANKIFNQVIKDYHLTDNVDIPVFANGDITSIDDAIECLELSKAQGTDLTISIFCNTHRHAINKNQTKPA